MASSADGFTSLLGARTDFLKDKDSKNFAGENSVNSTSSRCQEEDVAYGPALPPGFKQNREPEEPEDIIGPTLPPGLCLERVGSNDSDSNSSSTFSGSAEIIGPLPPTFSASQGSDDVCKDFERRASKMKQKLTSSASQELKREEWMTVLPPELSKNFGLGPRSFRRGTSKSSGDRSVWTDTPLQKLEKEQHDLPEEDIVSDTLLEDSAHEKYNEDMSLLAEQYNKANKREQSLLEIHQKNLKRKKKANQDKVVERRPFDRDVDLKVNLMDDAKRKALIKRSELLNDKFSHGKGQFL